MLMKQPAEMSIGNPCPFCPGTEIMFIFRVLHDIFLTFQKDLVMKKQRFGLIGSFRFQYKKKPVKQTGDFRRISIPQEFHVQKMQQIIETDRIMNGDQNRFILVNQPAFNIILNPPADKSHIGMTPAFPGRSAVFIEIAGFGNEGITAGIGSYFIIVYTEFESAAVKLNTVTFKITGMGSMVIFYLLTKKKA